MSEPLRDKQWLFLDDVPIHYSVDVKSAVEYRRQWRAQVNKWGLKTRVCNIEGCTNPNGILYVHTKEVVGYCHWHIEEHCYPDLFVEKEEERE